MNAKADLTYRTHDSLFKTPDMALLNTRWLHTGNGMVYELMDFVWDGESDRWCFLMRNTSKPNIPLTVRPLEHLTALREGGEFRYRAVGAAG